MLSTAKHLDAHPDRPFAALRVTKEPCHAERSEASRRPSRQTLRCAQGDKKGPFHSTTCNLCSYAQPPSPYGILDLCLRLMHIGRPQGCAPTILRNG
jgi:hypothetical protein